MKYAVVIEKTATGYADYVPDLTGIGVAGGTRWHRFGSNCARRRTTTWRKNLARFPVATNAYVQWRFFVGVVTVLAATPGKEFTWPRKLAKTPL